MAFRGSATASDEAVAETASDARKLARKMTANFRFRWHM